MKYYLALLSILSFSATINAQIVELEWANQIGGINSEYSTNILTDEEGNTYLAGTFSGTVDFDGGVGTSELTSVVGNDIFILKLDPTGGLIWVKQISGTYKENASNIALDSENNIIINGTFRGDVDFDPSDDEFLVTSTSMVSDIAELKDFFVLKLNTDGEFIWVKNYTPTSEDFVYPSYIGKIVCDKDDNIYFSMKLTTPMDLGTEDDPYIIEPFIGYEQSDAVFFKLNSIGELLWCNQLLVKQSRILNLNTDEDNNIYISSCFVDSVDLDTGSDTYIIENVNEENDQHAFLAKYSTDGEIIWGKVYEGDGKSFINTLDISETNIVVLGLFYGQTDFDLGLGESEIIPVGVNDIFIQKIDLNGEYIWAKSFGDESHSFAKNIKIDDNEDIYLTGSFDGEMDINLDEGELIISSIGVINSFILKLNENGSLLWKGQYPCNELNDYPLSLAIVNTDELYVAGIFTGEIDVDPDITTTNFSSAGYTDIFITKLNTSDIVSVKKYPEFENEISIYPNPFSEYTVVHFEQNTSKNQRIVIYDILGNIVVEKAVTSQNMVIEKDEMRAGIYLLSIVDMEENEIIYNGKLVVQ